MSTAYLIIGLIILVTISVGFLCFSFGVQWGTYKLTKKINETRTLPDDDDSPPNNVIKMRPRQK